MCKEKGFKEDGERVENVENLVEADLNDNESTNPSSSDSSSSEKSDLDSDESYSIPNNKKICSYDDRKIRPTSHPRKKILVQPLTEDFLLL